MSDVDPPVRPDDVDETSQESFPASDAPSWTAVTGAHGAVDPPGAADPIEVVNDERESRFEISALDGLAYLTYRVMKDGTVILIHTEVPAELAGRGLASRLARTALDLARARGVKVIVRCPFVTEYIARHAEYQDLVLERPAARSS